MKKVLAFAGFSLLAVGAFAQTNLQVFYDLGSDRKFITTTLEGFHQDNWGNTFFFIDYDYNYKDYIDDIQAPSNTYFEIARCLNFWSDTKLAPLSLQVEYNGGFGTFGLGGGAAGAFPVTNAWLFGVDYFLHSADFANTLNLKVLYKKIKGDSDSTPLQFTAVWGMQDLFGVEGLRFSGFADFWGQKQCISGDETDWVFLSEPQLWYNVGRFFGCENLNIGGEVELGYNFAGNPEDGFVCNPCVGAKWVF